MQPCPPIRAPHYFWDEDGPATLGSAQFLLGLLCDFAGLSPIWKDREGRDVAVSVERETKHDALITLSGALEGRIELSVAPSLWVRAEVYLNGAWFGRGWIERCYEECEIWPDASDGVWDRWLPMIRRAGSPSADTGCSSIHRSGRDTSAPPARLVSRYRTPEGPDHRRGSQPLQSIP